MRIINRLMDLSLSGIYSAAFRGTRRYPLIYMLVIIWGIVQFIILFTLFFLSSPLWLISVVSLSEDQADSGGIFYITLAFLGILSIIMTFLAAAMKAGVLSYGSQIRRGNVPRALDFFSGILKFTPSLFIGGIVIGMLTSLPLLALLVYHQATFNSLIPDIFSSGWNFTVALEIFTMLINSVIIAGFFQVLIFFWVSPWDEMLVLKKNSFSDALAGCLIFVFSRRHFLRVFSLIVANVLLAQVILLLTNIGTFISYMSYGIPAAYLSVLAHATQNAFTSFFQFVFLPVFVYSQLFLIPLGEQRAENMDDADNLNSQFNTHGIVLLK